MLKAGYGFVDNGVQEKNLYYYHPDHLGSSSYITNKEGQIIQYTEYMAFGEILFDEHNTNSKQPYLFNGKELDFETGLYYYGARYYDPKTSIWLNVDPLVEKTMSPYAYVNNNPINLIDPTGMIAIPPEDSGGYKVGEVWKDSDGSWTRTNGGWKNNDKNGESYIDTVTLLSTKAQSNRKEAQRQANIDAARYRFYNAVENCKVCQEIKSVERFMFLYVLMTIATGGAGGFSLSGQMAARSIGGRILGDISIQTLANATTNGGDVALAINKVNLVQTALSGIGMNYIGNSVISASTNIGINKRESIFTGTLSDKNFFINAGLGILGGATANGISNSNTFRGFTIGSYMQTTSIFGQTVGGAVGNTIMNIPNYGTSVIQTKISP